MQIIINNQVAAIKSGTSFEYVSENRLFGGGDDYTFAITLPLAGCPANQAIFGHLNRADVVPNKIRFNCEIRSRDFIKYGTLTITEITEQEVKVQFLAGRSAQNFDKSLDNVYINELNLGNPPVTDKADITPANAWDPAYSACKYVALPWVNDYSGNIQNKAECIVDDEAQHKSHFEWSEDTSGLSWQPYLLYLTKKICGAIPGGGYSYDFSEWEASEEHKYLLICNAIPYAWMMPGFANAMPHWTVKEYFEKLELFLDGEFNFDHKARRITFAFTKTILGAKRPVCIQDIVEEHTTTQIKADEKRSEYRESKNLVYRECDHEMWKFYSCDWFVKGWKNRVVRYDTLRQLLEENRELRTWNGSHLISGNSDRLLYAADCDTYFVIRPVSRNRQMDHIGDHTIYIHYVYQCRLQPVNLFGGRIVSEDEDTEQEEIEFVPAWIDDTEEKYGHLLFLSLSGYDEDPDTTSEDDNDHPFMLTNTVSALSTGVKDKKAEYFDRIYIGWYDGTNYFRGSHLPYPNVDNVVIADDWSNFAFAHFSMRLNAAQKKSRGIHAIKPDTKTTFKFLADTIPDARAVFHIKGRRYVCEKITATISDDGMSQLMKGEFWPMVD